MNRTQSQKKSQAACSARRTGFFLATSEIMSMEGYLFHGEGAFQGG